MKKKNIKENQNKDINKLELIKKKNLIKLSSAIREDIKFGLYGQ